MRHWFASHGGAFGSLRRSSVWSVFCRYEAAEDQPGRHRASSFGWWNCYGSGCTFRHRQSYERRKSLGVRRHAARSLVERTSSFEIIRVRGGLTARCNGSLGGALAISAARGRADDAYQRSLTAFRHALPTSMCRYSAGLCSTATKGSETGRATRFPPNPPRTAPAHPGHAYRLRRALLARLNCAAPRWPIRAHSERCLLCCLLAEKDTHKKGLIEVSRFGRRPKTPEWHIASGNTEQLPRWAATFKRSRLASLGLPPATLRRPAPAPAASPRARTARCSASSPRAAASPRCT
jgi:hypothetical protein